MKTLGLTGGVGMGKSAAANLLQARGLPIIDTDLLARQVVAPGQPALQEIKSAFGAAIVDGSGQLRRPALAQRVFADPATRRILEDIVHPRIRQQWLAQADRLATAGAPWAVVVIPLLFETDAAASFDTILCVACSPGTQRERLRRRGWTDEQIRQRIQAQWPIDRKIAASDYLVWTEPSLEVHALQLDRVLTRISHR